MDDFPSAFIISVDNLNTDFSVEALDLLDLYYKIRDVYDAYRVRLAYLHPPFVRFRIKNIKTGVKYSVQILQEFLIRDEYTFEDFATDFQPERTPIIIKDRTDSRTDWQDLV